MDGGYGASFAPPYGPGFIPFKVETSDALHGHRQLTQEVRIESKGAGALKWQAGLFGFDERHLFSARRVRVRGRHVGLDGRIEAVGHVVDRPEDLHLGVGAAKLGGACAGVEACGKEVAVLRTELLDCVVADVVVGHDQPVGGDD